MKTLVRIGDVEAVIFVHLYKERKKWKNYMVKRIMEIEKKRHDEVMKMLHQIQF